MDKGVAFVIENFEKTKKLCDSVEKYKHLSRKIKSEFSRIKNIRYTGNMIEYFDKFANGDRKYANDFAFLREYGLLPNEEISNYLRSHFPNEIEHIKKINDLLIGESITTGEIMSIFGVKYRGSLRKSNSKNLVVIISDRRTNRNVMTEKGVILYKALGGSFDYRESKAVRDYEKNNTKLYLFETYGNDKFYYFGEVVFSKEPYVDKDGSAIFPLKRKNNNQKSICDDEHYGMPEANGSGYRYWCLELLDKELYKKATESLNKITKKRNKATESADDSSGRDKYVISYVKRRANGRCDLCNEKAPFVSKEGAPFLECHHIIRIADGGPDQIFNAVALCPNCHRRMHNLHYLKDYECLVSKVENYLGKEDNSKAMDMFCDLFKKNKS